MNNFKRATTQISTLERGFMNQLLKELGPGACEGNDHNE